MSGANALLSAIREGMPTGPGGPVLGLGEVRQAKPLVVDFGGLELEADELTRPDTLELAGPLEAGDTLLISTGDGQNFHILHRVFHEKGAKA